MLRAGKIAPPEKGAAAVVSPASAAPSPRGEGAAEIKSSPLFKGSLPDAVRAEPHDKSRRPKPTMVGEMMGQSFTTVEAGLVQGGVGLDLQQEGAGPVYVSGKRAGGPAALCRELITQHGAECGDIQDNDVLLTIDGNPVKIGVNSDATLKAVRKGILGPPGTVVTLHFEREVDTLAVPFRYHVKLTRVAKQETSSLGPSQREQDLERENADLKAEVARLRARVDFLEADAVPMTVKLGMDFKAAGDEGSLQRSKFEKDLVSDLATASGLAADRFKIRKLAPGSVLVGVNVYPEPCGHGPSAAEVSEGLARQADDPSSALRRGKVTSSVSDIALPHLQLLEHAELKRLRAEASAARALLREKAEEEAAVRELFKNETDEVKLMRKKLLLGGVMKKWFMRSLAKAFNPWAEGTFERQRIRQLEIKAVRHWQHRGLSPAWQRWCEFRAQRKRIKGKTKNVVLRWARQLEAKALQSWCLAVLKRRRAVKAAKMWVNRALSRSWNSWYESHLQLQRLRNLAAKAASRWKHRPLSRVWVTWYEEHLQLRRLRNLSLRALKMWKERALCKGFAKWWTEVLRTRKARKAAAMWKNICLARALRQWIQHVSEANRLRLTADRVVRRLRNQAFAKSWGAWYSWHLYLRNLLRVANTVILRWMHGVMSKCFQKWWLDHVVRVRIMTRALARMKSRFVAKAYSKWCDEVVRSRRLSRIILRWAQRKQSLAFVAWDAYVRESQHQGISKPRRLIEHTIKQWQNKVLSAAWNSWILEVKQAARRRQMLSNATLKWLNRALAQAMEKWRHEVVRKRKALKAVTRWTHGVRPFLTKLKFGTCEHANVLVRTPHMHSRYTHKHTNTQTQTHTDTQTHTTHTVNTHRRPRHSLERMGCFRA